MALTDVLASHGIKDPTTTIRAAADAGLELAAACVSLMDETSGGVNEWGHDTSSTNGTYTPGGIVTADNYHGYRAQADAGHIPRNGAGFVQLTSRGFQDAGDHWGGCWDPYANMRGGWQGLAGTVEGLAGLVGRLGVREGFARYNGSGSEAESYGARSEQSVGTWRAWIGGQPSPAPAPVVGLPELHQGDQGELVWKLAVFLNRVFPAYSHINAGPVPPCTVGPQIVAAVTEFQSRSHIPTAPPFAIGDHTWAALEAAGFRP